MEKYANNWTPEHGFKDESLKNSRYGYPRPTAGKLLAMILTRSHKFLLQME